VLVHGLTFDRRIWQPIIDRLGDSVTSLAIDLPAHGESKGEPVPGARRRRSDPQPGASTRPGTSDRRRSLHRRRGRRLSAATYPTRGIVIIDQATEGLRAFVEHCNRRSNGA